MRFILPFNTSAKIQYSANGHVAIKLITTIKTVRQSNNVSLLISTITAR